MTTTAQSTLKLAALLEQRRPKTCLPGPLYADEGVFQHDMVAIFENHWLFVGVEPEIPEAGDFRKIDIGRNSIILVRGDDMLVRAFHNVCRHRGSQIVTQDQGFTGNLVCPYHQWTYRLDGALIHAQNMEEGFDPSCHGLRPVHLKNISGLLFICLGDNPPADIDDIQARLSPYIGPHDIPHSKIAHVMEIVENGNWKLTIENNRECYHCGGHPELLCSLFQFFGYDENDITDDTRAYYERYKTTLAEFEAIWAQEGLPHRAIEELDDRVTGFRTERMAMDGAGESFTMDTKIACQKLMGQLGNKRLGDLHLHMQPNSWHHFLSDHAICFVVIPLSADRTLVRTIWMVHKDAVEGVDYSLDNLTNVWKTTNDQDRAFVENAHNGVKSPSFRPGPFARPEYQVDMFCNWYVGRMKAWVAQELAKTSTRMAAG